MSNTEKIKFKLHLSGTYTGEKTPEYRISVDGVEYFHGFIKSASGEPELFEFSADVTDGAHALEVHLLNKENTDVIKDNYEDPDNFQIIGDLLLNIVKIEIEDIDLGNLIYSSSKYYPIDNDPIQGCVNLGWNGKYVIEFTSPFYIWLLENL